MGKISDLLHEFQDIFHTKLSKIEGIVGDLGEMKTPFRPDAKPVKQKPYRLNRRYKKKVKFELDQILEAGLIEPVEESEWIIPVVVQEKET